MVEFRHLEVERHGCIHQTKGIACHYDPHVDRINPEVAKIF